MSELVKVTQLNLKKILKKVKGNKTPINFTAAGAE
jgi:hypothetical protein